MQKYYPLRIIMVLFQATLDVVKVFPKYEEVRLR